MVGPYQLAKTIGAGSMGKVKVALDTRTNKRVAAKIIPLQQPGASIYFPSGLDTTAAAAVAAASTGPIDTCAEPWMSWLAPLALEDQPDAAAAMGVPLRVQRRVRLLQPRERYTTKDRERRENKDIRIVREVAINRLLYHPNICMLHDVVVHPNHYYIFQELVSGGQMLDYIISHGRLKEKHARKFARQIASAIDYCHHNSIVHRDLKIENILISANGNIKLIDFGLSNLYSPRSQLSTFCGSLYFAAPELLCAQPYTGPEVDLWSFGVVLYVLVCGKVPFDDQSMPALHAKIKRGHVEYPAWLSPECRHLLSRLLVVAPQRRATMAEAVRHPWMCKGYTDNPLINNHLPARMPLVSAAQIDRAVVREMARYIGFGFGSEEEIRIGLEAILTEDWYRAWLKDTLAPHLSALRARLCAQAAAGQGLDEPQRPVVSSTEASSGATLVTSTEPASRVAPVADVAAGDVVPAHRELERKRSSFWKRSSTFISGGLSRTSHKAILDAGGPGAQPPSTPSVSSADKNHGTHLRMRIFSDGKQAASGTMREGSVPSLSMHVPPMHLDPGTGMVGIWSDGRLAPPDVDCAAIQQEYHNLVASDPLLSIYFLVKERREREAFRALQTQPHRESLGQRPQPLAHASVDEGPADSSEAWIKLVRIPEQATPADRPAVRPKTVHLATPVTDPSSAESTAPVEPKQLLAPPRSYARHSSDAVDQTTAAIEALSLRPRPPDSGALAPMAHGASTLPPSADPQGSRKKRSSIFKRFSTIVKSARPGSRLPAPDSRPAPRIVQTEGGESGYMEISVRKSGTDNDNTETSEHIGGSKQTSAPHQQGQPPPQAPAPESLGARLRGTKSAQQYAALDSIDEDKEYAAGRAPERAHAAEITAEPVSSAPEPLAATPSECQYLNRPLCAEIRADDPSLAASSANGALNAPAAAAAAAAYSTPPVAEDTPPVGSTGGSRNAETPAHPEPPTTDGTRSSTSPRRPVKDADDVSSIFASTDAEDGGPEASSPGAGRSPSEKAALLERARREIDDFDEQEGVGLLDQTPELSYRTASQFSRAGVDTGKNRARSSSNTVVRMLTDIVRDTGGSGPGVRAGKAVQSLVGRGARGRGRKSTSPLAPSGESSAPAGRTIPRHSSTGAINRASDSGPFGRSPPDEKLAHSADVTPGPPFHRPDIPRSHSHAADHPQHPARPGRLPANALGIETVEEVPEPPADSKMSDSKRRGLLGDSGGDGSSSTSGSSTSSGIVDLGSSLGPGSPAVGGGTLDAAGDDIMDDIEVAPPRADEYLKPVFLKGLFSVATTSTRSPTVIRANLLSVLGGMPLRFHEGKGYFTCSMATAGGPANIQEDALDAYTQPDPEASHNSSLHKLKRPLRLPVVDRRISFRRRSKRLDEAPLAPALPTDALHGHDDASSNEGNTSDARQSGAESAGERVPSRPQPSVKHKPAADAICFQIFLVRMPLLGLHGLQFRRVSGPAWRYKDACSEILKQLKL